MTSFLFWNVMKRDLRAVIAKAVAARDVDILLIAESGTADAELISALEADTGRSYIALSSQREKIKIYSRIETERWRKHQSDNRMVIWSVAIGQPPGILLAAAHFVSNNNTTTAGQALLVQACATEICRAEDALKHTRTVLVGDLNMNPFEPGLTGTPALHAVMTKALASRDDRVVHGRTYRHFYNPMWGLFGDRTEGPPGTYYHWSPGVDDQYWHIIDQVLLRPSVMDRLQDLAILDTVGDEPLLTLPGGLPRVATYSDHLPLAFRLDLD